jgi:Neurotransmitter-gated ion-channel ligand binding domain
LTLQSWIDHRWNDSRLKWNPDSYSKIDVISVEAFRIWVPKLFLNDSHFGFGLGECDPIGCSVRSTGEVICLFPCVQTARCLRNLADWPVDIANCSMVFKTTMTNEDISIDQEKMVGVMYSTSDNRFEIVKSVIKVDPKDKKILTFKFDLQRHSETIYKHVHVLTYAMAAITLSIFCIDTENVTRLLLCGVNVFLHFSLMDRLWWQ